MPTTIRTNFLDNSHNQNSGINSHLCEKCFFPPYTIYIYMTLYNIAYPTAIFSMSTFLVKDDKHAHIVTKNENSQTPILPYPFDMQFMDKVYLAGGRNSMTVGYVRSLPGLLSLRPLFLLNSLCQTSRFSQSPFLGCPNLVIPRISRFDALLFGNAFGDGKKQEIEGSSWFFGASTVKEEMSL